MRAVPAVPKEELRGFVEEAGLFFERSGVPRMAGRILGWLLVCEPPEQSLTQLGEAIDGSKGSMSTMTRMLIQMGLVERVRLAGSRLDQFRIRPGMWAESMRDQLKSVFEVESLLQRGLELMADRPRAARERPAEAHALYAWFGRELPKVLDRWERWERSRSGAPRQSRGRG
jgi:DNA-binding transcriptional regulator GbsR (MarR family)